MYANAQFSSETSSPAKTLIRSGNPVTRKVTLVAGALYAAGSVLGTVTADGKAKLSAAAAVDGSQTPDPSGGADGPRSPSERTRACTRTRNSRRRRRRRPRP